MSWMFNSYRIFANLGLIQYDTPKTTKYGSLEPVDELFLTDLKHVSIPKRLLPGTDVVHDFLIKFSSCAAVRVVSTAWSVF